MTYGYRKWMIWGSRLWKVDPKIWISSRSTVRFYLFCDCGRALICLSTLPPLYLSDYRLPRLYDSERNQRSLLKVYSIWTFYTYPRTSIYQYLSQSQCDTPYGCDSSFCELWRIITHRTDDEYRHTSQYFSLYGTSNSRI